MHRTDAVAKMLKLAVFRRGIAQVFSHTQHHTVVSHSSHGMSDNDISSSASQSASVGKPPDNICKTPQWLT